MTNCCDLLIAEHRQTEHGLLWLQQKLAQLSDGSSGDGEDWASISSFYTGWAAELYRHFVLEEEALFNLLSQYRTMMLMTVEHDDLCTLQAAFEEALAHSVSGQSPHPELMSRFQSFQTRLQAHIVEEERGIFPLAQACLLPEEQQLALRRYQEMMVQSEQGVALHLLRSAPSFQVEDIDLHGPVDKPLSYTTLYDREHASVQHVRLQAGMRQALHWVGPHQCLFVLSGSVTLETPHARTLLSPGQCVILESQLYFAFHAHTDAHLLNFKVWPHPHYTKTGSALKNTEPNA